jgi:hypothetical protein
MIKKLVSSMSVLDTGQTNRQTNKQTNGQIKDRQTKDNGQNIQIDRQVDR